MSEQKERPAERKPTPTKKSSGKKKQDTPVSSLIVTIVVAAAAAIMAVVAVLSINKNDNTSSAPSLPTTSGFTPTQELMDECRDAAKALMEKHGDVIRLYITEGLDHYKEPYGNLPEDGIYTVNSTAYKTYSDIEKLVKSVYVEAEANRILTNFDGSGLKVYLPDIEISSEYFASTGTDPDAHPSNILGISSSFTPNKDYEKDWSSIKLTWVPISETQCEVTIYLNKVGGASNTSDPEASDFVLKTSMVKENGEWRLSVFVS